MINNSVVNTAYFLVPVVRLCYCYNAGLSDCMSVCLSLSVTLVIQFFKRFEISKHILYHTIDRCF